MIWLAVRPVIRPAATLEAFVNVRSFTIRIPVSNQSSSVRIDPGAIRSNPEQTIGDSPNRAIKPDG
jgi:hypothetical protein